MGHPVNVVFHQAHPHHPQVSPVVYCYHGGGMLLRDLRRVIQDSRSCEVADCALRLAIRWALEYGQDQVAVWNLETPGLPEGTSLADSYPIHLSHARREMESNPEWVLVDLIEFKAASVDGVWELEEEMPIERNAAPKATHQSDSG